MRLAHVPPTADKLSLSGNVVRELEKSDCVHINAHLAPCCNPTPAPIQLEPPNHTEVALLHPPQAPQDSASPGHWALLAGQERSADPALLCPWPSPRVAGHSPRSPTYSSLPDPELSQWLRRCQKCHQLTHRVVVTLLHLLKN